MATENESSLIRVNILPVNVTNSQAFPNLCKT